MSVTVDAFELPTDQRVEPAYRLLVSVDTEPGADAAWQTVIADHIVRYDAGSSPTMPAAEVFARPRDVAPGGSYRTL